MKTILRSPFVAALIGGVIVAAALLLLDVGDDGSTTTVVQQAPLADSRPVSDGQALTAREIYRRDAPGVVFVTAEIVDRSTSPFDLFPQERRGEATGSGFVIDDDGSILTNAHVVQGARKVTVQFEDKKSASAEVVGTDPSTDLALLKVDPDGLDLAPLALGSSKGVQVGDPTIAIGNPFGLDQTLTTGVVSAIQRRIPSLNQDYTIDNVIQTDAAINPGNSGGPLLDAAGRVIGINSQIETGGGSRGSVGIGFAVPIDTAKDVIPQLRKDGKVERAYLGISTISIDPSLDELDLPAKDGALIQEVQPGSPADKAGLRAGRTRATVRGNAIVLGGDIIREIDGTKVSGSDDISAIIGRHKPGDKVEVTVLRDGRARTVTVALGTRPTQPAEG